MLTSDSCSSKKEKKKSKKNRRMHPLDLKESFLLFDVASFPFDLAIGILLSNF